MALRANEQPAFVVLSTLTVGAAVIVGLSAISGDVVGAGVPVLIVAVPVGVGVLIQSQT
jgi:hypothetical protein